MVGELYKLFLWIAKAIANEDLLRDLESSESFMISMEDLC